MRADLHTHSNASDGTSSPSELVRLAAENDVDVLAIADHDTVAGLAEAIVAATRFGIRLIPAVELSTSAGDADIHILAYFLDISDPRLISLLASLRDSRRARGQLMVEALQNAGYDISFEDVLTLAGGGVIGRSHIGRALVATGGAESVADAFDRLIGRNSPHYRPKEALEPEQLIGLMRSFGALPVLAHPGVTKVDELIEPMRDAGLLGIEAFHTDHTAEQTEHYVRLARRLDLLVTGGSDFHGAESGTHGVLGSVHLPQEDLERFLEAGTRLSSI